MQYSRVVFYYRKYLYYFILISLALFILLQILQYHYNCTSSIADGIFGYFKRDDNGAIVLFRSLANRGVEVNREEMWYKSNENLDQSVKNNYFGDFLSHFLVFVSRLASLEKKIEINQQNREQYNSKNQKIFITQPSRVMDVLKCKISAIYRSKYYKKSGMASDFALLEDFSEVQAWNNAYLHHTFDTYLPPDQSALASGTLIGAQGAISKQFHDDLITTGLIHVVVASGYNLTIVMSVVQSVTARVFPKRVTLFLSLGSVWWYVGLALFNSAIVRSGVMASIVIVARLVGRPRSVWRVVLLSVLLMVAVTPSLLVDISFQLSVSSTIGVLAVSNQSACEFFCQKQMMKQQRLSALAKVKEVLLENARITIGANAFTLPIILFWFKRLSLISIVANVSLLWLVPYVMSTAALLLFCAHIHQQLASLSASIVNILASVFVSAVHFFATVPNASIEMPPFSLKAVLCCYVVLYVVVFQRKRIAKKLSSLRSTKAWML